MKLTTIGEIANKNIETLQNIDENELKWSLDKYYNE